MVTCFPLGFILLAEDGESAIFDWSSDWSDSARAGEPAEHEGPRQLKAASHTGSRPDSSISHTVQCHRLANWCFENYSMCGVSDEHRACHRYFNGIVTSQCSLLAARSLSRRRGVPWACPCPAWPSNSPPGPAIPRSLRVRVQCQKDAKDDGRA